MQVKKHRTIVGMQGALKKEVSAAMQQWALVVISHAADHAPIKSGALRRSLTYSSIEQVGNTLTIRVGPDQTVKDYAARQELDTSLGFGKLSLAEGATRPWLRPAFKTAEVLGKALVRAAFARVMKK